MLAEPDVRTKRDEFRAKLKEEWTRLWTERFDDKTKAEGISVRDYPLLFMNRGHVIFASRDAKAASFSEVMEYWRSQGFIYSPDPNTGGWGKFIRAELKSQARPRARESSANNINNCRINGQLKKGGKGWLHLK